MSSNRLKTICITTLGSGFAPVAPGTWGSLVAVVLFAVIWCAATTGAVARPVLELAIIAGILLSSWLSVRWGPWAIEHFGHGDPRQFTLDEFAGQWVALLLLPTALAGDWLTWLYITAGQFLLFRLFDIVKPPPARQAERLPAGWGVLTDDLIAGAYANLVGQMLWRWTPLAAWLGVSL